MTGGISSSLPHWRTRSSPAVLSALAGTAVSFPLSKPFHPHIKKGVSMYVIKVTVIFKQLFQVKNKHLLAEIHLSGVHRE